MINIKNRISNLFKYRYLLQQLVMKDLKVKYKRSVLGIAWSLLNPLLTMLVLTIVFKELFRFNIENFSAYLISGLVMFNFFSESTSLAISSIYTGGQLIKKVYVPKYIFPLSKILYSFINLLISFVAVIIVCIVTGVDIHLSIIFTFLSMIYLLVFSIGIGLILSSFTVFFRDFEHIYGVLITIWMYSTPIIYPVDIVPDKYLFILYGNPLYYYVTHFREALLYGSIPPWELNYVCIVYSVVTLLIGIYIFNKKQDKFILYI